ncbi:MAG: hypothetical protein LBR55_04780 [Bacteroidales bacterium]|jgi:LIVCS family branched-chain amino acid:cation transporter|nr:hypothetical protein [Bacteroidales bacterium]
MKNLNPLKIGKYTFWISFIIGNFFMFGFLLGVVIKNNNLIDGSAYLGYLYLYVATAINLIILLIFLIWGIGEVEKRKQCFTGIAIMLINIPLAILYASIGLSFNFQALLYVLFNPLFL